MLAFKLRYLLESGLSVLLLFGFFFLALRYFEGQRTSWENLRIAGLVMLPEVLFILLGLALPPRIEPGSALMTAISMSSWLVPLLVFLVLWKVCKFTAGRALWFSVVYLLLGFLAGFLYLVMRPLLPPYVGDRAGQRVFLSLIQVGILLVPLGGWALTRLLGIRVSPLAGSFLVALVFAPVVVFGHGLGVVPAFLVWMGMFIDGDPINPEFGYMFVSAIVSVIVTTVVVSILYRAIQRLRVMPAEPEYAD